jgi:hypothetical protein
MLIWLDLQKSVGEKIQLSGSDLTVPYSLTHRFNVDVKNNNSAFVRYFFNGLHTSIHEINTVRRQLEDVVQKQCGVQIYDTPLEQIVCDNLENKPHWIHVWVWTYLPVDDLLAPEEDDDNGSMHSYNFEKQEVPNAFLQTSRTMFPYDVAQFNVEGLSDEDITLIKHKMLSNNPYIHFRREHYSALPKVPFIIVNIDPVR